MKQQMLARLEKMK
jgi:hypothetical protein